MADQDPFSGLRTGPWVGTNNDPLFKGLTDENTVVPGGVIEDQSITNAKIVNLNAEKIDAGTLKVTGSMTVETSGTTPQLEIGANGTIMRDNAGLTVLEINGVTTTLNADIINAGTINGSLVDVTNINADNINAGALTLTPLDDGSGDAIVSTNFTVSNAGAVTARDLTIIPATPETQGIDAAAGAIILEPPTAFGAVILKVTNSDGTGDFDTVGFTSSAGAAANGPATVVTDTVHNFKVGQMVSFHDVNATWNAITAAAPIQIITTPTTTSFTVEHFIALPSVASNSAGTIRAYKRLSVRAAGGLYVYRDAINAGDIAAGSLVLGNNLASYGKDSLATVADGELAFIKAATPRYGSGGNLYSKNGTTNVSTSGSFDVAGEIGVLGDINIGVSDTSVNGAIVFKGGNGGSIRAFSASAGNDALAIKNTSGSAYTALVADAFFPGGQGSFRLDHDGNFDFNDSVDITGSLTVSSNLTVTGGILANGSIEDPSPLTTTATANNAVWVIPAAGEPYGLRRFTSSQRYKTNIVDADEVVLEAAKKIRPRHFTSTLEDENGETRLGFIAEEVEASGLTHAVGYNEQGQVETIDTTALIAALYARVNDLEERLKTLEGA